MSILVPYIYQKHISCRVSLDCALAVGLSSYFMPMPVGYNNNS